MHTMPENKDKERQQQYEEEEVEEEEKPVVAKTAIDLQRLKLQKLMKNPEKPVILPERPRSKNTPTVPEFVRNVMGSSAGAGSGEFHVYRHLRRKEYARQKFIQEKSHKEILDEEYHKKIEENKRIAEEVTAKKRAKRLKKKQKWKEKKRIKTSNVPKPSVQNLKGENNRNLGEEGSNDSSDDDQDSMDVSNNDEAKSISELKESNKSEMNQNESIIDSKYNSFLQQAYTCSS